MVHLHAHTEYSLLDGAAKIQDLVKRAKELGQTSLAITDHGNLFGVMKFYNECKEQGVKPIIGCEMYIAERGMEDKDAKLDRNMYHLVLLCKNKTGYKNLIKLVSDAYTKGFYYKPRTDKEHLKKYSKGLIALSACLAGKIPQLILENKYEEAKNEAFSYEEIFGKGNFFIELQNHFLDDDKRVLPSLIRISRETGIPMVATNDSHYILKEDAKAQEILLCMQTKGKLGESKLRFDNDEFYLKSDEEMRDLFPELPEAIDNTHKIAEMCNLEFKEEGYHIPVFDVPEEFKSEDEYFTYLCEKGYKERFGRGNKTLRERMEYEIDVIKKMGFVGYFLIVQDFINWAKDNGIPVGPARGSGAGSLVAFVLKITEVDPIKHDLIFERFLNPDRVSMPDIDVDFCIRRREEVIEYVREKYGDDKVCQIATFGTMKAKMAIRDVARVMGLPYSESDALAKMIPNDADITIDKAIQENKDLRIKYVSDSRTTEIIEIAKKLEGNPRQISTHAAGVLIAPDSVDKFVPLAMSSKGVSTEFTMTEIEKLGLLKMDFLGLRNLTVIDDTIKMIKETKGIDIDINNIDYDDKAVYEYIGKGKTVGIFQLESQGITDFIKKLKPECFEDIVAGVSLYRPGPMDFIPKYIQNKRHQDRITYDDPRLEPILRNTYGCIVYQEQVMQIVQTLAGFSAGRADVVRKAMGKKKADIMAEEREYFIHGKLDKNGNIEIEGAVRRGIPEKTAEKIWDEMEGFARYAFNKSHSTGYSMITYQTAWLKYHFPSEFMACLMSSAVSDPEHLEVFIKDAKKINVAGEHRRIKILPPSVFTSKGDFTVEDGDIRFGLNAIKNVGENIVTDIVEMNKDGVSDNPVEFLKRINRKHLNSKAIEALISSGAMNGVVPNIHTGITHLDKYLKVAREEKNDPLQVTFFELSDDVREKTRLKMREMEEYDDEKLLMLEKESLGTYISQHPLDKFKNIIKEEVTVSIEDIVENKMEGREVIQIALITAKKEIVTKKGERMAFLQMESLEGGFETIAFPTPYKNYRNLLNVGKLVTVIGRVENGKILAKEFSDLKNHALLKSHILLSEVYEKDKILKIQCKEISEDIIKVLKDFPGTDRVILYPEGKSPVEYTKGVTKGNLMMMRLTEIVGEGNVK